jgi:hypothetical protein
MNKKDFNELAQQLAIVKPTFTGDKDSMEYLYHGIEHAKWSECVYAVMLACKSTSANFDRGRFLTACGVPNIGVK